MCPRHVLAGALCALALSIPIAASAGSDDLKLSLTALRVTSDPRGHESFKSAEVAPPGGVVEYRAQYANAGSTPARDVLATIPIPAGTEFVAKSAVPAAGVLASLDGTTFQPVPLKRLVKLADGTEELREVPASEYRYLRWTLGSIDGGKTRTVRARVRVSTSEKP